MDAALYVRAFSCDALMRVPLLCFVGQRAAQDSNDPGVPMEIPKETYEAIENQIASDSSPVGIDAKKTHVMILHQLSRIEARLERIEASLPLS